MSIQRVRSGEAELEKRLKAAPGLRTCEIQNHPGTTVFRSPSGICLVTRTFVQRSSAMMNAAISRRMPRRSLFKLRSFFREKWAKISGNQLHSKCALHTYSLLIPHLFQSLCTAGTDLGPYAKGATSNMKFQQRSHFVPSAGKVVTSTA